MTTNMRIETPFPFCPLCDHLEPEEIEIYGMQDQPRYRCKYYYICEDAVGMYKRANKEKDKDKDKK